MGQDRSGAAAAPSGTEAGLHYLEGCAPRRLGGAGRYGRRRGRCGAAFSGAGLPASPARLSAVDGEVLSVSGDWGRIGEDSKAGPRTPRCDLAEGGLRRLGRPLAGVVACSCAPRGAMAALLTAGQVSGRCAPARTYPRGPGALRCWPAVACVSAPCPLQDAVSEPREGIACAPCGSPG